MKKTEKPGTYGLKKPDKAGKKPGEKWLISFRKVLVKPTSWLNRKHGEKSENRGNRENREKPLKNWLIRLLKVLVKPTSWLNGKKQGEIRKPGKTGKNREDRKPGKPVRVVSLTKYLMFSSGSMRFIQILLKNP